MHNSVPAFGKKVELIDIEEGKFSPLISKCQIKVCYVGQEANRNGSIITKEVAKEMAFSLRGSPIVGYFNNEEKDFEAHNRCITESENGEYVMDDETQPYGFVDLNANVWFKWFNDDGIPHEYVVTEGWLWTGQYPKCKRVVEKGNNQSMELDESLTSGSWTNDLNNNVQFFIINEAIISKLCILGENYEPCFEGSQITSATNYSLSDDFKNKIYSMMTQIKEILEEGGKQMESENIVEPVVTEEPVTEPVVEEESVVTEEPAAETVEEETQVEEEPVVTEEPAEEPAAEEPAPATYDLNNIPEYTELLNNYNLVCSERDNLNNTITSLNEQISALTNFKLGVERKEKENMINSFYMLSDEDRQEVRDNIDNYSLEEIESKLSVLCVRKKVSFELDDGTEEDTMTVNMENTVDNDMPAWIRMLDDVANRM